MDSHTFGNKTKEELRREKRMIKIMSWGYVLIGLTALTGITGYATYNIHKHNQKLEYSKKKYLPGSSTKKVS